MARIVVITTKGQAKKDFINAIQEETNGAVILAVLQNVKRKGIFKRASSFYKKVGLSGIVSEIYYFLAVKLSERKRQALATLSVRSILSKDNKTSYLAKTIETNDVNEESVYRHIQELSPDIIVIWGGYIIKPHLLETARFALNMHSGFVPYYRGVNGIEHAIINGDFQHIGITIHKAISEVDAGEVIKIITSDYNDSPYEFFKALNDSAAREYIEIIKKIMKEGKVSSEKQNLTEGKNYLLKEWTYKKQNALAEKILTWGND